MQTFLITPFSTGLKTGFYVSSGSDITACLWSDRHINLTPFSTDFSINAIQPYSYTHGRMKNLKNESD